MPDVLSTVPTHPLVTVDPDAPDDDLRPLLDLVGDARVVALGENNHHVREFLQLRHRITRALVEHAGFTHYALESGFAEGHAVDRWLRDGDGDPARVAVEGTTFLHGHATELHAMLRWMREHGVVRFSGLDLPSSAGSAAPALHAVREYLQYVDADSVGLADDALKATSPYSGGSSAVSPGLYAAMDARARDAATVAVSRLLAHLESLRPVHAARSSRVEHAVAEHHARGAWRLDQYQREMQAMTAPPVLVGGLSSRDTYMADTVRLLLDHDPSAKLVLGLHNGHLQRVPFTVGGVTPMIPVGQQLASDLGEDYVAVAMTSAGGTTTGLSVDGSGEFGASVHVAELPPAEPGSIEHVLGETGPVLLDLRDACHGGSTPDSIRHADSHTPTPVFDAFDALIQVPTTRPSGFVRD